jgi:AraC-like DNA-binding protein
MLVLIFLLYNGGVTMEAQHQKSSIIKNGHFPVNVFNTDVQEFPPHWHERIEIVYVLGDELKIGQNNAVYTLKHRDIFIVGMGEVHYFLMQPQKCDRIIVHFEPSLFDELSNYISGRKIIDPLITYIDNNNLEPSVHSFFEKQILSIQQEILKKEAGFEFMVGARLYDIGAGIIRYIPNEKMCSFQKNKQLKKLEILEQVTTYIDENFRDEITLAEVSKYSNFSMFHFTRFFKDTTGMTFGQYLNNYKVSKAVNMLINTSDSILEIAFNSGFNSIKTFNRVFKQLKGCSPSDFKRAIFE